MLRVRISLPIHSSLTQCNMEGDINFDVKVMAGYRRFCNKIYQATKYVLGKLPLDYCPPAKFAKTGTDSLPERWIIHRMNDTCRAIHGALEKREFSRSSQIIYQYWYSDLCDVFIVCIAVHEQGGVANS